jgi:uncharacterized protein
MENKSFKDYLKLRDEVDEQCSRLWNIHSQNMQCKSGCSSCCQAFRILPIEFYYILDQIKNQKIDVNQNASDKECVFLIDNKCSIYEHRPIICRTHGYPMSRLNEEVEAYEISFCPLNFKEYNFENFNAENLFSEDVYNSKLFMLNKKFVIDFKGKRYESLELVELNHLLEFIV